MIDLGRDCAHPGILSNEHFANRLVNETQINNTYLQPELLVVDGEELKVY